MRLVAHRCLERSAEKAEQSVRYSKAWMTLGKKNCKQDALVPVEERAVHVNEPVRQACLLKRSGSFLQLCIDAIRMKIERQVES